jgi:AraC family transcriptional regulator
MGNTLNQAMRRVITMMYERVGDELTVDDLARTAVYSKFHFSRTFRRITGVSPGRFLSALRFQEAKRLLVHTSLSVAEISNQVGYSSLGTFSTRFKKFIGVTPTEYRRAYGGGGVFPPPSLGPGPDAATATVVGGVDATLVGEHGQLFLGLFPDPVPRRTPVCATVLPAPGAYELGKVPAGTWYLLAQGVAGPTVPSRGSTAGMQAGSVGRLGPITVAPGEVVALDELRLRPMGTLDLPVLPAPFASRPWELTPVGSHVPDRAGTTRPEAMPVFQTPRSSYRNIPHQSLSAS